MLGWQASEILTIVDYQLKVEKVVVTTVAKIEKLTFGVYLSLCGRRFSSQSYSKCNLNDCVL